MAVEGSRIEQVDLTNCDREPIHKLGHVQPFSYFMAFGPDWCLARGSENLTALFDRPVDDLVGTPIGDLLGENGAHHVRNLLALAGSGDLVERSFERALLKGGMANDAAADALYDIAAHRSDNFSIVEIEGCQLWQFGDQASFVRTLMTKLDMAKDIDRFLLTGAKLVRQVTGFDRVMVYRFHDDGHGEVVSESAAHGVDSFLGLHYPASDIPVQARALYVRNIFRIIVDTYSDPVPILPREAEMEAPIDLSLSVGRAVSPMHIEYLKNMGIAASLSISIIVDGKLWGLFACHHHQPRLPSFKERTMAELFSQMFSLKLEGRLREKLTEHEQQVQKASDALMAKIANDADRMGEAGFLADMFEEMVDCDGIAVLFDGKLSIQGTAPPADDIKQMARRFDDMDLDHGVAAVNCLGDFYAPAKNYPQQAAGMLVISISRNPRDYVMLFRKELAQTINWAGNPEKPVETGPSGARLTPRGSFDLFKEEVSGCCRPFTDIELYLVRKFRTTLIEVVLRVTNDAREMGRVHAERQDLLIGELNHRVRNILALIRGIVRQSKGTANSAGEYIGMLQGRIEAMARAHDQITQDNWSHAPLTRLIETEASAYLNNKAGRVKITGQDVLLSPPAFSTMALVFHELMTNSAKYGALSDNGRVDVKLSFDSSGNLELVWSEIGGPPVKPPTRRGFGSTILQRTVPHDLHGDAEIEYNLSGLVARFMIPARHFKQAEAKPVATSSDDDCASLDDGDNPAASSEAPCYVMVVEDNLIVAMDNEAMLQELGVEKVEVAASTAQAFSILSGERPDYALLDFNLGSESSTPIAEKLVEMGVPFAFATGYGDQLDLPDNLSDRPVLQKPFEMKDLHDLLCSPSN